MAPLLVYWKLRGLAHPIRMLLNYKEVEFEDKQYEVGDGPEFSRDCWLKEKFSFGLDFPNLPYYVDGAVKLSQTNTILRYLARKYDLCGSTEQETLRVDMMNEELVDVRSGAVRIGYNPDFETLLPEYKTIVAAKLQLLEAFIGDGDWVAGNKLTFVDFVLYDVLDIHRIMIPTCLDNTPKLQRFISRLEALPTVKAYMESDKYMRRPLNNKMAPFK